MNRRMIRPAALLWAGMLMLAGCGGAGLATPTPIPADVVRPAQPTPVLSTAAPQFRLDRSTPEPIFVSTEEISEALTPPPARDNRSLLRAFLMDQPPTAMGIATGGVTLLDAPNGSAIASVPAGKAVTVTGRSADGAWLAAFTEDSTAGWIPAGSVVLFGADDLITVDKAFSPGPVATMLAKAMTPVASPVAIALTARARTPDTPQAAGTPEPEDKPGPAGTGAAAIGTVQSTGNLNLRDRPSTDGTVVGSLPPRAQVVALGRTADAVWLQVRTPAGDGWVSAQFVALPTDAALLPVTD